MPDRIDEIETRPIHIWETPCSCHCSKEQAAFCPVIRACRYPEHPHHERAKAIMAQVMSFPQGRHIYGHEAEAAQSVAGDPPEEIDALVQAADDEYAALTTEGLKERIASLTGARPRGNPSRQTLVQSLRELEGAA